MSRHFISYLITPLIICAVALSCVNPFAPKVTDTLKLSELITQQKTPEEVLTNFKYAYTFKDSTLYSNLLDSSFVFVYFDPNSGTSGRFVSWGRSEDLRTTGKLFRSFTVIDLTWNSTIYAIQDSIAGLAESSKSFRLSLVNDQESITIGGTAVFSFKRDPKEDMWRITRWKDESDL
ncbi:hypothetical protein JW960_19750 [candidate division KSB1 bacterium]|nr:hypothetical protein [candidate division KSB1 bacterium]